MQLETPKILPDPLKRFPSVDKHVCRIAAVVPVGEGDGIVVEQRGDVEGSAGVEHLVKPLELGAW